MAQSGIDGEDRLWEEYGNRCTSKSLPDIGCTFNTNGLYFCVLRRFTFCPYNSHKLILHQTKSKDYEKYIQDRVLRERKQGEERNCPYHGTCDNQRNYRTVQLQAERDQGNMGAKGNRAKGRSKEANEVNFALDNIKAQIAKHYQRLSDREAFVTAEMVRNAYQGIGTEYETLLRAFDKENAAFAQRVGKDRAVRTYRKYLTVRKYVAEFIKFQYKRSDMSMNELTEEFIRDFCLYLKNVIGLTQSTIWIYSIPLKHIVTAAHYNGKIQRNPFAMYHVDPDHKEREFLTEEELDILAGIELENPNFAFARDLFMFGCWTGISFVDIKNLTEDNVAIISGSPWIVSQRQKTGVPFKIKLIDAAIQIIERYKPLRKDMHLFNIGSLDMVNKRIKKVAKMCGIKKRISFHVSRHSFAVLALNYGMPIESVSKILGHTDIATTQIYAKVTSTKLEHDISAFESRIKGHMPTMGGMA